jgi:hypothetical protein
VLEIRKKSIRLKVLLVHFEEDFNYLIKYATVLFDRRNNELTGNLFLGVGEKCPLEYISEEVSELFSAGLLEIGRVNNSSSRERLTVIIFIRTVQ